MAIERRQTYFPGGKNQHELLPKPEPGEIHVKNEKLVEASRISDLPPVSRRISRPVMRMSLKNGDNPWTNYAPTFAVNHAGPGIVAQRKGQLR
jgi:hypothetical protein